MRGKHLRKSPLTNTEPRVLVVNAGSSSLKVELLPERFSFVSERLGGDAEVHTTFGTLPHADKVSSHREALDLALTTLKEKIPLESVGVVGHRVVHGGEIYTGPTRITDKVISDIAALCDLAPLHNGANLEGIRAALQVLPKIPHVAVFDTAFHTTLPSNAYLYGLPRNLYETGIRVYGFHGTSHDYVTQEAARVLDRPRDSLDIVSLHLGNGASAAAVQRGKSIDTTMGFTPLDGLLMGTRSGDLDPGVVLHLLRKGHTAEDLDDLLNRRSGLLGLSGVSSDMRDVKRAANEGNRKALEALDVFYYRIRKTVGAYAAAMGGLDAVVFTAGIGENDAATRTQALQGLSFLGIELDEQKNQNCETVISAADSRVQVLVIPTDEALMIARGALNVIGSS